jgi:hypothetical protein
MLKEDTKETDKKEEKNGFRSLGILRVLQGGIG